MLDTSLCSLTVQGWVHDCTGLGAQVCRAGCTSVHDWVHFLLFLYAELQPFHNVGKKIEASVGLTSNIEWGM